MSNSTINVGQLAAEIAKSLTMYGQGIQKRTNLSVKSVAKRAAQTLKQTSPKSTGDYAKGWQAKPQQEFATNTSYIVHNKTSWQLTHLLEESHALRDGGRSTPRVHIKPAEEMAIAEFIKEVEGVISNADGESI